MNTNNLLSQLAQYSILSIDSDELEYIKLYKVSIAIIITIAAIH